MRTKIPVPMMAPIPIPAAPRNPGVRFQFPCSTPEIAAGFIVLALLALRHEKHFPAVSSCHREPVSEQLMTGDT